MREGWEYILFEDGLEHAPKGKKIPSANYKETGLYPIVSQEDSLISGYWNNKEDVIHIEHPVVIFGDHTRILKYIDFDFVIGADGVKILSPKKSIRPKFLYYYLKWQNIPSLGYSRHYKLLKELSIPVPPLSEQQRIVSELDLLTSIIDKQKAQLKELDTLAQSIFYDMFGDPVENEKGWDWAPLENQCTIWGRIGFRGYTRNDFVDSPKEGAISLSPTNIINNSMVYDKCSYISWAKYDESPEIMINNGDILLVKTGSSYGKCALVRNLPHKATINPQFVVLKDHKVNSEYLAFLLSSDYAKRVYDDFVIGTAIPTFSQANLKKMPIPLPPLSLQQSFAAKIEAIEKQKTAISSSLAETQKLFDYTMDKYFG